jgi:UDP-glucose 4-epimerase
MTEEKTVLITGGGGYIGSHLANFLARKGLNVVVVDIFRSKYLENHPLIKFVKIDVRDVHKMEPVMKGVEAIFHLAFVQVESKLATNTLRSININGTRNVLNLAMKYKVKKFIHTSTVEVYGQKPISPISEQHPKPLDTPLNRYALMKIEAENLAWEYYHEYKLPVVSLRFPIVCGEGFYAMKIFLHLIDFLVSGKPLVIVGDGTNKFTTIHITDAIEAYYLAYKTKSAVGHAFNIATENPVTTNQLIQEGKKYFNSRSIIMHSPVFFIKIALSLLSIFNIHLLHKEELEWATRDVYFNISKAKKILGFNPQITTINSFLSLAKSYIKDKGIILNRSTDNPFK